MRVCIVLTTAAITLAGCDEVFGLDTALRSACENPGSTVDVPVLADATLDGATARGADGILRLSASSRVLVRLQRRQQLDRITLRLSLADYGIGCNPDPSLTITGCVPCQASSLGEVEVYAANNDWDEATVTGVERAPGAPWTDADHVLLGTFPVGPTGLVRIEGLDLAAVEPRLVGDELTLELVGAKGTDARFSAREGNACVSADGPTASGSCEMRGVCGDSARDADEECDGARGCTKTCEAATCGDGMVNATLGEECDDGNFVNTDTTGLPTDPGHDSCDRNCTIASCGNGLVGPGEQCDDQDRTAPPGLVCAGCRIISICGNGVTELGESCDDGDRIDATNNCDSNCTITGCGNGIVTPGELCDDGNFIETDDCLSNCTPNLCGNGNLDPGEECDDGNHVNNDGCSNVCLCGGICRR